MFQEAEGSNLSFMRLRGVSGVRKITTLRSGKGRRRNVKLLVDGSPFAELEPATSDDLRAGKALSDRKAPVASDADDIRRCADAALGFLSYRPRSEAELRQRLGQKGFSPEVLNTVVARLTEQKLLDDPVFAQFWKDNRQSFRPQSQRLTRLELKRKGVADDVIDSVVSEMDDEDSAHRAALSKSHQFTGKDYLSFRRRMGGYLQRRGFSSSVIRRTLEKVWGESMGLVDRPGSQQIER